MFSETTCVLTIPPQELSVRYLLLMVKPSSDAKQMVMLELIEESE